MKVAQYAHTFIVHQVEATERELLKVRREGRQVAEEAAAETRSALALAEDLKTEISHLQSGE
jgi:hypothetical protein